MKQPQILGLLAVFVTVSLAAPMASSTSTSQDVVSRDGTTEFDPDFLFKSKRDGTTEFDPDFGFKSKRDGTTEFDPDFGFKSKRQDSE
ncbi:hypothetical protein F5X98DRAFT_119289 [Xylaria grammica]|nr:hypothetical protein F5X98DRAFT_119289 [Xylaria grammica]